jgi:hypothetical protein
MEAPMKRLTLGIALAFALVLGIAWAALAAPARTGAALLDPGDRANPGSCPAPGVMG